VPRPSEEAGPPEEETSEPEPEPSGAAGTSAEAREEAREEAGEGADKGQKAAAPGQQRAAEARANGQGRGLGLGLGHGRGGRSDEPVTCESARNHGEYVSWVARSTPEGPDKAAIVAAAAESDCGKPVSAGSGDELDGE
jgi:hypothetical protein